MADVIVPVWQIHVGSVNGTSALAFSPSSVNATKGSVITFVFDGMPGNHTVAQSAFGKPCEPLEGGFDSGFIFVPQGASAPFPTWNLTITDDSKRESQFGYLLSSLF